MTAATMTLQDALQQLNAARQCLIAAERMQPGIEKISEVRIAEADCWAALDVFLAMAKGEL